MDDTYDANFGEWIRNEENARIVGYNLKKYLNYDTSSIIVCIKWIVKDWTLRSIISLMRKMTLDELNDNIYKRLDIIAGVIFTWNTVFISEFLVAMLKGIKEEDRVVFAELLFKDFSKKRIEEVVKHAEGKIDKRVKECMMKRKNVKRQRINKVLDAYTLTK